MKDLPRNINLYCDICGNDHFKFDSEDVNTSYTCTDCGKVYTKEELLEINQSVINANIDDIKKELISEIQKELNKKFR